LPHDRSARSPISTIIHVCARIADIAVRRRETSPDPNTALSCVQVFALGARLGSVDAAESGYSWFAACLAKSITEAQGFIAERGIV